MGGTSWLSGLRARLSVLAPEWGGWGRLVWCVRQQRALRLPRAAVVWVRRPELAWATWGERHGFFELAQMDGLSYLRTRVAGSDVPAGPSGIS